MFTLLKVRKDWRGEYGLVYVCLSISSRCVDVRSLSIHGDVDKWLARSGLHPNARGRFVAFRGRVLRSIEIYVRGRKDGVYVGPRRCAVSILPVFLWDVSMSLDAFRLTSACMLPVVDRCTHACSTCTSCTMDAFVLVIPSCTFQVEKDRSLLSLFFKSEDSRTIDRVRTGIKGDNRTRCHTDRHPRAVKTPSGSIDTQWNAHHVLLQRCCEQEEPKR